MDDKNIVNILDKKLLGLEYKIELQRDVIDSQREEIKLLLEQRVREATEAVYDLRRSKFKIVSSR